MLPPPEHAPSALQARLQRGNILLKQGHTQEARQDFEAVVSTTGVELPFWVPWDLAPGPSTASSPPPQPRELWGK